jgi:VanZ family protein
MRRPLFRLHNLKSDPSIMAEQSEPDLRRSTPRLIRLMGWLAVSMLVVLSVVPAAERPVTPMPHSLEHFISFALAGALQYLGYAGRLVPWLLITSAFAGGIELLQLAIPGRHARFSDFVVDALAACIGVLIGFAINHARAVR